jgi:hypothetical protein
MSYLTTHCDNHTCICRTCAKAASCRKCPCKGHGPTKTTVYPKDGPSYGCTGHMGREKCRDYEEEPFDPGPFWRWSETMKALEELG